MGRELKPSKTRITHTLQEYQEQVGFDFLGWTIRQFPVGKTHTGKNPRGRPLGFKTIIPPRKEAVKRHTADMKVVIDRNQHAPQMQGKLSMDYSPLPQLQIDGKDREADAEVARNSLYEALQGISDPRRGAGKRYPLAVLLCLLLQAKMAEQTTLKGVTEWVRLRVEILAASFGLKRVAMPCQMTYTRLLERLSAFFPRWEAELRCGDKPSRLQTTAGYLEHAHVAIDGKAVRATSTEAEPVHQLSAYDLKTGVVLFQVNIQEKQNEISALKPLLTPTFIKDRIFTLDAMHTQTAFCQLVNRFEGFYVLVAKNNQPTLFTDLVDFFDSPPPDWRSAEAQTWDKAHGRLEHRRITCSPELNEWFATTWAGGAQVFRLQRTTTILKSGKERREVVYGITNLSVSQSSPAHLLAYNRQHWGIESRLHWRRDLTRGEDRCQTSCSNCGQTPSSGRKPETGEPCARKRASTGSGRGGEKRVERQHARRLLHCRDLLSWRVS